MITDDLLAFINDEISLDPSQEIGLETDLLLTGLVDSLGVVVGGMSCPHRFMRYLRIASSET